MLIKAKEAGCLEEAALATAIIEEKDFLSPKRGTLEKEEKSKCKKDSLQKHSFNEDVACATDGSTMRGIAVDPDLYIRLLAFEDKSASSSEYSVDNQIMKRILKEQKQLMLQKKQRIV